MATIKRETYDDGGRLVSSADITVPDEQVNADTLRDRARQALAANEAYLGLANPTAAQTTAQVQRLTRECSALIRLHVGALDSTVGT